ncbi:peptidase M23B [Scytonema sp. HK-05]|uniref:M23 family metallopeptidase n=1 Tax=Scytonema sp. HK-05 TaxID=1137095 RepID=UPI0009366647|nr:M23 family metallopeptidase [Scytonema sp. HK-05]OKH51550.1 peptidase M23 [Scytonema sp. HK-05]BAY45917.1 peptidase M23B [Scytonema sp. HK-05]
MTQRNHSTENRLHQLWHRCLSTRRFASTLPAQSLAWLGSISMLSNGGLVFAQTESAIDNIVPTAESSQPAPSANTVKKYTVEQNNSTSGSQAGGAQPEFSQRRARLRVRLSKSKASSPVVIIRNSRRQAEDSSPEVGIRKRKPQVEVSVRSESLRKLRARVRSEAARSASQNIREEKPQVEALQPSTTVRDDKPKQEVSQKNYSPAPSADSTSKDYNNSYIDPTEYQVGATNKYEAPNSVVITQRSNGCRTVVGQNVPSSVCAKLPYQSQRLADSDTAAHKKTPSWMRRSKPTTLATVPPARRVASERNSFVRPTRSIASGVLTRTLRRHYSEETSGSVTKSTYHPNRFIPNFNQTTTVSSVPIAPAAGGLSAPMTADNVAPRPSNITYDIPLAAVLPQINYGGVYGGRLAYGGTGLMYPLSAPSPITSLFGWRVHPITGDRRFHSGTDIGAAMGTPVLAAYSGKVESADWLGGYGMTVILNHTNAQQTLYGHMSEIFVQPGQVVEKGTVIGRVGSTGNSTGPHLHFEVRQLTPEGWVATDPGTQLEYALGQLIQSLHTAQAPQQSGS